MILHIFLFTHIISKIVIVDDIGLSKEELQKLKDMKGKYLRNKIKNMDKKNVLEFPKDFINQKEEPSKESNEEKKQDTKIPREDVIDKQKLKHNAFKENNSLYPTANKPNASSGENINTRDDNGIKKNSADELNDRPEIDNNNEKVNFQKSRNQSSSHQNLLPEPIDYDRQLKPSYEELLSTLKKLNGKANTEKDEYNKLKSSVASLPSLKDEAKDLARQEKDNLIDANRARTSLLDLKITESRQRQEEIEKNLFDIEDKKNQIDQKLKQRKEEQEQINLDVITLKNRKINLATNKRKTEVEKDKIEATLRLINNEISHLNKRLDDLKSKSATAKDEKDVYENRLRQHEDDLSDIIKRLGAEEMRQSEYYKEVNGLDNLSTSLKNQVEELKTRKSREGSMQDRLEMERDRMIRNNLAFT
ncbi:hypothetical protein COBT_002394 [Conglomerata obtusa]